VSPIAVTARIANPVELARSQAIQEDNPKRHTEDEIIAVLLIPLPQLMDALGPVAEIVPAIVHLQVTTGITLIVR
jgi:hypothetical protein